MSELSQRGRRALKAQFFGRTGDAVNVKKLLAVNAGLLSISAYSHQVGNSQQAKITARQNLSAQLIRQWRRRVVGVAQLVQLKRRRVVVKDRFHEVFIGDERPVGKPGNPVTVIPEQAGTQPLRKNHVI